MFGKLNDNVAALVLGIYLLGIMMYVVQLIFMTEAWLAAEEIDVTAVTVARVLGAAWLGFGLGIVLTFSNGPEGQITYYLALLVAQVATLLVILYSHFIAQVPKTGDDAAIVAVLTLLLLIGWARIRSRL